MEANPVAARTAILLRWGQRKADGQPVSLFEMAAHIVQMGQDGYHKAVTAMPQRQQQTSPEVEQLRAEMAQMKAEQTRNAVIGPFAAQNPRFNEPAIQQSIAQILKRSEEHTSELQSLMRISYADFCLKKKKKK